MPAGTAFAAPASGIGYVDLPLLVSNHPDVAVVEKTMKAYVEATQKEFAEKSVNMNNQDKQNLYNQLNQQLASKERVLMGAIQTKVAAAVKEVAEKKGLTLVVDKKLALYGGEDITAEVERKLSGQ